MKLRCNKILYSLLVLLVVASAYAIEPRLEAPKFEGDRMPNPTFGDDRIVSELGGLLQDPDPITREVTTRNLGETHNSKAITFISRAMDDRQISVRCAAAVAAGEIGDKQGEEIILRGLTDESPTVVLSAMRSAARLKLDSAFGKLQKQLSNNNPLVRGNALKTLTILGKFAGDAGVLKSLDDSSMFVRLSGAENSTVPKQISQQLFDKLIVVIKSSDADAVRAVCIESVGKQNNLNPQVVQETLSNAYDNKKSPVIRRAAVKGYFYLGSKTVLRDALKDKSPIVRLVAIWAEGKLKDAEAIVRIGSLMVSAPDTETHHTARKALQQIATPEVAQWAAVTLKSLAEKLASISRGGEQTEPQKRMKEEVVRNMMGCCWLLGEFRSHEGYETMLKLLTELEVNSPIVGEISTALGKIGDERAVAPLTKVLGVCRVRGMQTLIAMASMSPGPPYSEKVTAQIIEALGVLKATSTATLIRDTGNTSYMGMRLPLVAAAAVRTLPKISTPENQKMIEDFIVAVFDDKAFGRLAMFNAAEVAGEWKMKSALDNLRVILNKERPTLLLMQMAAWGIQEIEGQTPKIPYPVNMQGNWILTLVKPN